MKYVVSLLFLLLEFVVVDNSVINFKNDNYSIRCGTKEVNILIFNATKQEFIERYARDCNEKLCNFCTEFFQISALVPQKNIDKPLLFAYTCNEEISKNKKLLLRKYINQHVQNSKLEVVGLNKSRASTAGKFICNNNGYVNPSVTCQAFEASLTRKLNDKISVKSVFKTIYGFEDLSNVYRLVRPYLQFNEFKNLVDSVCTERKIREVVQGWSFSETKLQRLGYMTETFARRIVKSNHNKPIDVNYGLCDTRQSHIISSDDYVGVCTVSFQDEPLLMKTKISDVSFDYDYAFLKAPMYTFLGMCPIDNSDFIFEPKEYFVKSKTSQALNGILFNLYNVTQKSGVTNIYMKDAGCRDKFATVLEWENPNVISYIKSGRDYHDLSKFSKHLIRFSHQVSNSSRIFTINRYLFDVACYSYYHKGSKDTNKPLWMYFLYSTWPLYMQYHSNMNISECSFTKESYPILEERNRETGIRCYFGVADYYRPDYNILKQELSDDYFCYIALRKLPNENTGKLIVGPAKKWMLYAGCHIGCLEYKNVTYCCCNGHLCNTLDKLYLMPYNRFHTPMCRFKVDNPKCPYSDPVDYKSDTVCYSIFKVDSIRSTLVDEGCYDEYEAIKGDFRCKKQMWMKDEIEKGCMIRVINPWHVKEANVIMCCYPKEYDGKRDKIIQKHHLSSYNTLNKVRR